MLSLAIALVHPFQQECKSHVLKLQLHNVLSLDLLFKDLSRKMETSQFLIDCEGVSYCFLKNSDLLMSILA